MSTMLSWGNCINLKSWEYVKSQQSWIFLSPLGQFLFHDALSYIAMLSGLTALRLAFSFSSVNLRSFSLSTSNIFSHKVQFCIILHITRTILLLTIAYIQATFSSSSPLKQFLFRGAVSYIASQTNGCDTALVESKKQNATQIISPFLSFQFLKFLLSKAEWISFKICL